MIELKIDNRLVEIPTNLEFTFVVENPYFTDASEYTEEIEIYPKTPRNAKIFGSVYRHEKSKKKVVKECCLKSNNKILIKGTATTTEFTDKSIKLQLLGGNSSVNFLTRWDNMYIDKMEDLGSFINAWTDIYNKYETEHDFSKFIENIMSAPENKEFVMLPAKIKDSDETVNNWVHYFLDKNDNNLSNGHPYFYDMNNVNKNKVAIQPRLTTIVKRVINALGYEVTEFDAESSKLKFLYYVNVVETMHLNEMLPHWTVNEFLEEIQKIFCCVFVFDTKNMTCKIKSRADFFVEDVVFLNDVDDSFNVEFEDESSDITDTNLMYEKDCVNKLHLFDETAYAKSKIINCNSESQVEQILMDGEFNYVCEYKDRYYIKHCEIVEEEDETGAITEKKEYSVEEANHLGCNYNEDLSNSESLKIVPAEMVMGEVGIIAIGQNDLPDETDQFQIPLPIGIEPTANSAFNIDDYVHKNEEDEENSLDVMTIAVFTSYQNMPEVGLDVKTKETDPTVDPDDQVPHEWMYSWHYTKLWCGWTYHIDDVTNFEIVYPKPNFDCYSDKLNFNPTLALRKIEGWDTIYSETIEKTKPIDTKSPHEITFYDNIEIEDINKTYVIRGHKYLCQKIEMKVTDKGISKEKVGTFYRID